MKARDGPNPLAGKNLAQRAYVRRRAPLPVRVVGSLSSLGDRPSGSAGRPVDHRLSDDGRADRLTDLPDRLPDDPGEARLSLPGDARWSLMGSSRIGSTKYVFVKRAAISWRLGQYWAVAAFEALGRGHASRATGAFPTRLTQTGAVAAQPSR